MKKLLILIVAIAVYLHFYPSPMVTQKYEELKVSFLEIFTDATDTQIRLKADKVYRDLEPHFSSFNAEEKLYLKELTLTRKAVKEFYINFCNNNKAHPKFHITNQKKVCDTIDKYAALL